MASVTETIPDDPQEMDLHVAVRRGSGSVAVGGALDVDGLTGSTSKLA